MKKNKNLLVWVGLSLLASIVIIPFTVNALSKTDTKSNSTIRESDSITSMISKWKQSTNIEKVTIYKDNLKTNNDSIKLDNIWKWIILKNSTDYSWADNTYSWADYTYSWADNTYSWADYTYSWADYTYSWADYTYSW
jgi:hypothetical protein